MQDIDGKSKSDRVHRAVRGAIVILYNLKYICPSKTLEWFGTRRPGPFLRPLQRIAEFILYILRELAKIIERGSDPVQWFKGPGHHGIMLILGGLCQWWFE